MGRTKAIAGLLSLALTWTSFAPGVLAAGPVLALRGAASAPKVRLVAPPLLGSASLVTRGLLVSPLSAPSLTPAFTFTGKVPLTAVGGSELPRVASENILPPGVAVPSGEALPQLDVKVGLPGLTSLGISQTKLSAEVGKIQAESAYRAAAQPFEGGSWLASDAAYAPKKEAGKSPRRKIEELKPSAESGEKVDMAGRVNIVPSPKKKVRKLKRWHKILLSFLLILGLAAGGTYLYLQPHIGTLRPNPTQIVNIESPYQLVQDQASRIERQNEPELSNLRMALTGHSAAVRSLAVRSDGKLIVTVAEDGSWRIWNLEKNTVSRPQSQAGRILAARFADGGEKLILLGEDSSVRIVNLADGQSTVIKQNAGQIVKFSFSPDSNTLAVATKDGRLQILDISSGKTAAYQTEGTLLALAATNDGIKFITLKGMLRLWTVPQGGTPTVEFERLAPGASLSAAAISPDGKAAAAAGEAAGMRALLYLEVSGRFRMMTMDELGGEGLEVASVALDPSGEMVAVLAKDGRIWIWLWDESETALVGKVGAGAHVFFGPKGELLYTTDPGGRVRVWDTTNLEYE